MTPPVPPVPAESTDPAGTAPEPPDPPPEPVPEPPAVIPPQPSPQPHAPVPAVPADATSGPVLATPPVRQLSLFGVEAADPSVGDLAGLLAGPGELVRMGGTARITIVVDAAWRVHVLVAELARRGLTASWLGRVAEQHGVQTSYSTLLAPLAGAWLRGTVKRPPGNFFLTGPRLRLWAAAAGSPEPLGFVLRLGAADEACREPVGAALAAIGLPAVLLDAGAGGPAYRITGRRRLARLAELVGDRPPTAPPGQWPGGPP
ncbi:hypothetical protein [Plantactinospora mayteni]|uniref:hypothetical protein n=1 Tax=Plantactinospora mayteni TaxID=566021 RepID=UPI00355809AC